MFDSLSSPSLGCNSINFGVSGLFGGRKSSFDVVNNLPSELKYSGESDKLPQN